MIYGVSFSEDLADALAKDLYNRYKNNPIQLANIRLIVPTKRACLTIRKAFMKLASQESLLLPQLVSLYELDDLDLDVPSALTALERILLLARLCQAKPNILDYTQALKMALSLCELLDLSYQYDLDLSQIKSLSLPERFAAHWQETVQFLDILHEYWPKILKERGNIDPMDRSIRLIRSFTRKLQDNPSMPVVLAGFTNLFPALKELMDTVAQNRDNLILLDHYTGDNPSIPFYTELHRPQEKAAIEAFTKDSWTPIDIPRNTFDKIRLINAHTTAEEALTIALIFREILETPNQTGALVTTDRTLARQVISQMQRWQIQLDDSAGTPLNHTDVGLFFQLIADLGLNPTPTAYLALLKHPLTADGQAPVELRKKVQIYEKEFRENHFVWRFDLKTDITKWHTLFQNNQLISFSEILSQHIEIAEQLATSPDKSAAERLWQSEEGAQLFALLSDLLNEADQIGQIETESYPEILKILMQQVTVRPKYGMHPRLYILGPIEARFHHADVCIIGGLNDGVFPPLPETGPWLNRSMRHTLHLPAPEMKIQELAMDFAHNLCANKVYLTRALKNDSAQAIPSRFIERLKAVAEINGLKLPEYQAHLATLLDQPLTYEKPIRPAPCPPINVRPQKLPVTQIEMLRRNPYAIYARYVLKLFPLEPIEPLQRNAEFGSLIHQAIAEFFSKNPSSTDKKELLAIAHRIFEKSTLSIMEQFLLKIKFDSIADFVIYQQTQDLPLIYKSELEQELRYTFDINGRSFELYGVADRLDWLKDGTVRILDYKTYLPPTQKEVKAGFAPQLLLEALLVKEGKKMPVSALSYWYLSNKKESSCVFPIVTSVKEMEDLIQQTKAGLFQMITAFQSEQMPYEVCPIPSQAPQFNDYAHLARMPEWALAEGESA